MSRTPARPVPPADAAAAPRWPCVALRGELVALQVAVIPNAKRTQADGLHDGALRVRLAAPPLEGRANEALVAWLSDELRCPKRGITLAIGATGRRKRVDLALPLAAVLAWLDGQLAPP